MTPDEIRAAVDEIWWYHSIDLGHGIITPGWDRSPDRLHTMALPSDLTGKSVLDVGAWDGFFSFEAERRGAARVLATDGWAWDQHPGLTGKAGFHLARQVRQSRVEDRYLPVLDLGPEKIGTFDVVLFLGVLYHMRHPQLALEKVASVAGDLLILETHVDMLFATRPAMAWYPANELGGDLTNWCGPNPACVKAMLRDVGFKRIEVVYGARVPRFSYRLGRALYSYMVRRAWPYYGFLTSVTSGRMTFHAWR